MRAETFTAAGRTHRPSDAWYGQRLALVESLLRTTPPVPFAVRRQPLDLARRVSDLRLIAGLLSGTGLIMLGDLDASYPFHRRLGSVRAAHCTFRNRIASANGSIEAARNHAGTRRLAARYLRIAHAELCEAHAALTQLREEAGL